MRPARWPGLLPRERREGVATAAAPRPCPQSPNESLSIREGGHLLAVKLAVKFACGKIVIGRPRRDALGRCSGGEFFDGDHRANVLFDSAVAEGVPHCVFSQFVADRRHDHALVECQDARGSHAPTIIPPSLNPPPPPTIRA